TSASNTPRRIPILSGLSEPSGKPSKRSGRISFPFAAALTESTRCQLQCRRPAWCLYFKGARLQPWQLADVRPGVCYVGLVFKMDPSPPDEGEACCAAQMFLNSGNGVVFRGAL